MSGTTPCSHIFKLRVGITSPSFRRQQPAIFALFRKMHYVVYSCYYVRKDLTEAVRTEKQNLGFTIIWNAKMFRESIILITFFSIVSVALKICYNHYVTDFHLKKSFQRAVIVHVFLPKGKSVKCKYHFVRQRWLKKESQLCTSLLIYHMVERYVPHQPNQKCFWPSLI
jgi:hypothetical protein